MYKVTTTSRPTALGRDTITKSPNDRALRELPLAGPRAVSERSSRGKGSIEGKTENSEYEQCARLTSRAHCDLKRRFRVAPQRTPAGMQATDGVKDCKRSGQSGEKVRAAKRARNLKGRAPLCRSARTVFSPETYNDQLTLIERAGSSNSSPKLDSVICFSPTLGTTP